MVKVAIYGGSGYTGQELIRILSRHPEVEIVSLFSRRLASTPVAKVFSHLRGLAVPPFSQDTVQEIAQKAEIVFLALPHENSLELTPELLSSGCKVIDLSAAFRLRREEDFSRWYGGIRPEDLQGQSVYGLPELYRPQIAAARLVANPGCYPTSIILALAPLLKQGWLDTESIIVDSKSGVSGAGREASLGSLFCEVNESFKAYKVGQHRHRPEIEQELTLLAGREVKVTFTPHLLPVNRGILSTIYASCNREVSREAVESLFHDFYAHEPFVRIYPAGEFPNVSSVRGTNCCDIGLHVDPRLPRITLISVIDNLVKGASGQAVQNMNIMTGVPETTALDAVTAYP